MIRKLVGRVAVVAIVLGMTVAAPIALAGPAAAQPPLCGFLDDGSGAGSANSIYPQTTPYAGEPFTQQNGGAWQMCWEPSNGLLYPPSAVSMCEADNSGTARLRPCDPSHNDQIWSGLTDGASFHVKNKNGGYLCATGGVGYLDVVVTLSDCSSYHDTWRFEPTP